MDKEQIKAEPSENIGQLESEDLEKEIEKFLASEESTTYENAGSYKVAVKDPKKIAHHFAQWGAEWQKEQFEKNRLAATQTEEEYERETAFAMEIIEKEHRTPTFSDAINYGMLVQKEQMGKQAREHLAKEELTLADLVAFDEGMKLGRRLEKEQMLREAVDWLKAHADNYILDFTDSYPDAPFKAIIGGGQHWSG